ncbi:polyprenyl synthetase family protein [Furfurilactobacillus entadae]|uniref:polyprenyl synthetase family protein n=1 Tax=Furfurilactobacillus entadae TaxID=2922307 RepID=UPI0038B2C1CA
MMNERLTTFETTYGPQIEVCLADRMASAANQEQLAAAMRYSVMAGGKRLRPLLTLVVLSSAQVSVTPARLQAACALELVHTYSLIHDDLPAMDNDDLRRGKPTNHKKYGEDVAILAGDGLQTLAFDWLAHVELPADERLALVQALATAAGPFGMVAGQAEDVTTTGHRIDLARLQALHRRKTGALLIDAVEAGAIMAHVTAAQRQRLVAFGNAFGLAFQIYDDILDETKTATELGKTPHKDEAEGKNTYPQLLGMAAAQAALQESLAQAEASCRELTALGLDGAVLAAFLSYFEVN